MQKVNPMWMLPVVLSNLSAKHYPKTATDGEHQPALGGLLLSFYDIQGRPPSIFI